MFCYHLYIPESSLYNFIETRTNFARWEKNYQINMIKPLRGYFVDKFNS